MLHFFAKRIQDIQEAKRDERGFTLIELLVVVIIIGVLAAIAIPTFLAQRERSYEATAQSDLRNAAASATTCSAANNGSYTNCGLAALEADYDLKRSDNVTLTVPAPTADVWTATAVHTGGGDTFSFSTTTGKVARVP